MSLFHISNPYIRTSLLRDGRASRSRFYHSAFPLFSGCFSYEYWKYYTMSFSGIECLSLKKLCEANACRVTNFLSNKSFGLCYLPCTQEKLKQSPLSGVYMLEVLLTASSIKAMKRNDVWAIENASKVERIFSRRYQYRSARS